MIEGLNLTTYDMGFMLFILFGGILMAIWGFFAMISTVGACIGAALVTIFAYPFSRQFAKNWIDSVIFADIAAAIASFALALMFFMLIGTILSRKIQAGILGPANRALGFAFGLLLSFIMAAIGVLSYHSLQEKAAIPADLKSSRSYAILLDAGYRIIALMPDDLKTRGLLQLEAERQQAEALYQSYQLYQHYLAPKPHQGKAEKNENNLPKKDANPDDGGYDDQTRSALQSIIEQLQE